MSNFTMAEEVKRKILDGMATPLISDGHLIFTSIRLQQAQGEMCVEFVNGSATVCHLMCPMPTFSTGETLTLNGIDGRLALELEVV
jgi:DNA/RNA endonuclease YhcR with UshA esterase domain